jgi:hypothetical protein
MHPFEPQQLPIDDIPWDALIPLSAGRIAPWLIMTGFCTASPILMSSFPSHDAGSRVIL